MIFNVEDFMIKIWDSGVSVYEMLVDSGIVILAVHFTNLNNILY